MRLIGAATTGMEGAKQLPGHSNYFIGNNPRQWQANVPTYEEVRYRSVYPGVDLVFYGKQREFEYDFIVAPGADAARIRLQFGSPVSLDADGALHVRQGGEELVQHPPVVYQVDDRGARGSIPGRYRLARSGQVSFELGTYDHSRPLVIDPTVSYSTYIGGTATDAATSIAVDASGQVVLVGGTVSAGLATAGALQTTNAGTQQTEPNLKLGDVFVAKLNPAGNALVFLTYLGGSKDDGATDVALGADGSIYVTGITNSINFPTSAGVLQRTMAGGGSNPILESGDAFVAKLSANGATLSYSTYLGGPNDEIAYAIAVDAAGNAYIGGNTESPTFPTTAGAFRSTYTPRTPYFSGFISGDGFVAKLNPLGTALVYSSFLGGNHDDFVRDIAIDSSGAAYVTGFTTSTDFPTTNGAFQTAYRDVIQEQFYLGEAFVTKFNPDGRGVAYSTLLGGGSTDAGHGIAVDSLGNAYVAGTTSSANFPTTANAYRTIAPGSPEFDGVTRAVFMGADAFVAKLNSTGTALVYSTYFGGSSDEAASGIALDASGNVHITGATLSANFPVSTDAQQKTFKGAGSDSYRATGDAFIAKLNASGSAVTYATYLGGSADDGGTAIALDSCGNMYASGGSASNDFPTTTGTLKATYTGPVGYPNGDGYAIKLASGLPCIGAIVKAASYSANAAPGAILVIFGEGLAPQAATASSVPFPTTLGNVRVTMNGQALPLIYVGPTQINVQLPYETPLGQARLTVESAGQSTTGTVNVLASSPGMIYYQTNQAVAVNQDGQINGPNTPAPMGSVVTFYMVGQGKVTPPVTTGAAAPTTQPFSVPDLPSSITIGGKPAVASFLGLTPGSVGLLQGNVTVPTFDQAGNYDVVLKVGTETSNTVVLTVSRP
jgi:uncharacterized protein (TIGR03437 family)